MSATKFHKGKGMRFSCILPNGLGWWADALEQPQTPSAWLNIAFPEDER
jgi:hypothetical protein